MSCKGAPHLPVRGLARSTGPERAARPQRMNATRTRERVLELIQRHGWNATAFQTLESGYSYFFYGSDACVAYVDTGSAWVAAGSPISAPESMATVVEAFLAA